MYLFNSMTWGWTFIFWFLEKFVMKENENVHWAMVFFSNLTLMGPIMIYWITAALIAIGWVVGLFTAFSLWGTAKMIIWFALIIAASTLQWQWIDIIRASYTGDKGTASGFVDKWHDKSPISWGDDDHSATSDPTEVSASEDPDSDS
jgi:hypothetical protein